MGINPSSEGKFVSESLGEIEDRLKFALDCARTMDENHSVWHPNATPGVSVPLSNETMRLVDSALRDVGKLRADERYCDSMSEDEIARLHGEYCYNREVEFRKRKSSGYAGQIIGEHSTKCGNCPYSSEISCLLKFAMSRKREC